jgi:signal peptidase I
MNPSLLTHLPPRRLVGIVLVGLLALGGWAVVTGRVGYVVTDGVSMQPSYHTGDLVLVARSSNYRVGQIVEYDGGPNGHLAILHRIVGGDAHGFVIKGDNNQSIDPTHPRADQVIGRAVLHIPKIGAAVKSPITRSLVLFAILALLGGLIVKPSPRPGSTHGSRRASHQSNTVWKTLLIVDLIVLAAVGVAFGMSNASTPPAPAAYTQTAVLTYQAKTPVSNTYPTGQVATGDPVFTKLLNRLDVTFHYTTNAPAATVHGTVRLDAVLSTSSGWHTSLPLVAPTQLTAGEAYLTSILDLSRIQALAASVAIASGVSIGTIDIAVTGSGTITVGSATPAAYSTQLPLQLTPVELTLSGATPNPSPQGPAVVSTTRLIPASPMHPSNGVSHEIRLALLALLLLAVAGTAVVWPSPGDDDDDEDIARQRPRPDHPKRAGRYWS